MELKATSYEAGGGVAVVRLDRPERHNAWTGRMEAEYRHLLARAAHDPDVRAIVITGAGDAFCVGADARALDDMAGTGVYDDGQREPLPEPGGGADPEYAQRHAFLLGIPKPVIAAVNGAAAGVGFVIMCFADLRFAAAGAKLTTSAARLGLPAEHGLSWILPRLIGAGRAADLLFSSRVILADEAAQMGLVNAVFPPEDLLEATMTYARALAIEISPSSLAEQKRQLYADIRGSLADAAVHAVDAMERMVGEPDFTEGVAAYQDRRPPQFGPYTHGPGGT